MLGNVTFKKYNITAIKKSWHTEESNLLEYFCVTFAFMERYDAIVDTGSISSTM